jgi:hypothetical protein
MLNTPNGTLVYQTYFRLTAYAVLLPRVAACTTAAVMPEIFSAARAFGFARKRVTKDLDEVSGIPKVIA